MNVLITGSTGMVGKAVLIECLESKKIEKIVVVNRSNLDLKHPKINELILKDFTDFGSIADKIGHIDAVYHCMGVSSVGMNETNYHKLTFTVTESLANLIHTNNKQAKFHYVSGQGTDSSESGRIMWARVKGKTENMLLSKGFGDAYMYRIGGLYPEKGVKSKTGWVNLVYTLFKPFYTILRKPLSLIKSGDVGKAMIQLSLAGQVKKILSNQDIRSIAEG